MGNESSLPSEGAPGSPAALNGDEGNSADESEENGRMHPPTPHSTQQSQQNQHQASASPQTPSSATPSSERRTGERGQRPGARMIGAVFGKSARNLQQQSNTAGPQDPEDREKPRPLPNSYPQNNHHHHASDNHSQTDSSGSGSSYYDANMGPPTGEVVASHDYFAQAQQQNYYASQQQQQQHPHYPGGPPQTPHQQQQQHPPSLEHSSSIVDVEHKEHPPVGVMYEKPTPPTQKKSIFPGRATARGAALISSMRNLTLAGALRGGNNNKKEVNDWEKQWDEDEDDDSEDEDEQDENSVKGDAAGAAAAATPTASMPLHHHQNQVRPAMDIGHSELPMRQLSQGAPAAAPVITSGQLRYDGGVSTSSITPSLDTPASTTASVMSNHHHHFGAPSFVTPDATTAPLQQNDLASEWDMAGIQPPSAIVADDDTTTTSATPVPEAVPPPPSKPDVQMFLPMLRVLGKGSFGKVVLVQKRAGKERGGLFAMKILRKTHLVKRRQIERTRTERKVLSVVNHPFIMKLHYAFQTPDKLYLVLDYCPGGELFFHLSRFRRFPERVARFYAAELLLAIGHLHKRGIIYRDLKPENVLLDADGHVKLGDFGLAKAGIKHPCDGATSMCGTPEYMAPEVLAQAGHGFCVDYWGLGMLLYEMMTGLPPWYTTDRAKLFRRLKSAPLDIPSYFSVQAANCVSALLERNPRRRLGVTGIRNSMEHEFFRNISWKSLYARRVEAPIRPCEGWRPPDTANQEDDRIIATSAGPISLTDIEGINRNELDAATQNFDNTFTRMPVESEEITQDGDGTDESEAAEQLNDDTFLGFSFDSKDRDVTAGAHGTAASSMATTVAPSSPRARSHATASLPAPQPHHNMD